MAPQSLAARFLVTFKDYPPSQRPSSFSIDQIVIRWNATFEAAANAGGK
jgi:arylsulfatase